jgi:NAD-dependent dihydropyrimidine dehydrogenase PreA subunit
MKLLWYILINIIETLLRLFPFSSKTGLIRIGNPDRHSPVLLTCNFHLTVERVKRALKGIDAYLLVANTKGMNVWCASKGGSLTAHEVLSMLKTSGIEGLVNHRDIILPQLAAPGIDAKTLKEKTGWNVIWGPIYAKDIPDFIKNNFRKTPEMRQVRFSLIQRIEMAVAWAFPISVLLSLILLILWQRAIPTVISLIWGLSLLIYISFPLYSQWLGSKEKRIGFVTFDFAYGGFQLILWILLSIGIILYSNLFGKQDIQDILRWEVISLVIVLVLSFDLLGSTPVFKGGRRERRLRILLDESRCKGVGLCMEVCPRDCHELRKERQIVTIPRADRCVKCGACTLQCPFNALSLSSGSEI